MNKETTISDYSIVRAKIIMECTDVLAGISKFITFSGSGREEAASYMIGRYGVIGGHYRKACKDKEVMLKLCMINSANIISASKVLVKMPEFQEFVKEIYTSY